uniref:CSON004148 protein n=1 Tax=Culicoides sonorensis TaxID=179676 RepID=A0A336MRV0_CULSO
MAALAEENLSLSSSTPYKSKAKKLKTEEGDEISVETKNKLEESELEEGEIKDSSIVTASFHEYTFKSASWVDILDEEEENNMQRSNLKLSTIDSENSQSQSSYTREIAIEILDASNEAKFDRLLKEDKIKSPFRRHPSNELFDEAAKAELLRHDPSILDFKVGANSVALQNVTRTVLADPTESACDGFEFPSSSTFARPMSVSHSPGKRKRAIDTRSQNGPQDEIKKPRFGKLRSESSSSSDSQFDRRRPESESEPSFDRRRPELETDEAVLERRQKQIDYGKNTVGYDNYTQAVPKDQRGKDDPKTPPKHLKYSRRAWDGLVRQWRIQLHKYDPNGGDADDN